MQLPVYLDVPDAFRARAAYAVETMLGGCGASVVWTDQSPVVSIGLTPLAAPLALVISPGALDFFASRTSFDPARVFRVETAAGVVPVLFGTPECPDWISSAFFWLSGWQEWTTARVDRHGRFPFDASLQHALGTAALPVVDGYALHLAGQLATAGFPLPGRTWAGKPWALCPTHDVDALRKWGAKSLWRGLHTPGALWHALRHGDPYRRGLARLMEEEQRRGVGATYYLKAGAGAAEDHAYPLRGALVRRLFAHPSFEIGLHPSYHAFDQPAALRREHDLLARAAGRPIYAVRHHYLRFRAASSPALQQEAGFQTDSTLGWAEQEGWRRGTCRPFRLFDLTRDRPTDVWEMPLALMDTTLFGYRRLGAAETWNATEPVLGATRRFGGVCVALWHNTVWDGSVGTEAGEHFLRTLDHAAEHGALVTSVGRALQGWK